MHMHICIYIWEAASNRKNISTSFTNNSLLSTKIRPWTSNLKTLLVLSNPSESNDHCPIRRFPVANKVSLCSKVFCPQRLVLVCKLCSTSTSQRGRTCIKRKQKLSMVNFWIFMHKNVYRIGFQEIKIRPSENFDLGPFFSLFLLRKRLSSGKSGFRGRISH